jgi:hypothetical protein
VAPRSSLHSLPGPPPRACGTAAICAITGATLEGAEAAIRDAAAEDHEYPVHLENACPRHVARALELLGWDLFDYEGRRVNARDIQRLSLPVQQVAALPTAAAFLQHNARTEPLLCTAFKLGGGESHSFAAARGAYKDNGLFEDPSELSIWHVARVLRCRKR